MRFVLGAVVGAATAAFLLGASSATGSRNTLRCEAREPGPVKPVAGGPHPLVRSGATTLLLCRYRGLDPPRTALRLRSSRRITNRADITSIAAALNRLPSSKAVFHCPMDDGSAIFATFTYSRGAETPVEIELSGCRAVTGPYLPARSAAGSGGARLIARLERLAR